MDPFRLSLAVGPLAVYLAVLGVINLARRPLITTGARDSMALAIAVSGLITIGPIELFMPQAAAIQFGVYVWVLLAAFYVLVITLWILTQRPRLVVYNVSLEEFRPILAEAVGRLDAEARWAGNAVLLPNQHIEFQIESFALMRNVTLTAGGEMPSYQGWRNLESALAMGLRDLEVRPNAQGAGMVLLGLMLAAGLLWRVAAEAQQVAEAFRDMLRL